MSDTNRVAIRALKESTYGVVPNGAGNLDFLELQITNSSVGFAPSTTVSEKLRSDRQIDDLPLVGGEASGDIGSELSFAGHDLLLEGALFSTFQDRGRRLNDESTSGTQISAAVASSDAFTVTDESNTILADDIVRAEGFTDAANNGFFVADTGSSNTSWIMATDYAGVAAALADETPGTGARLTVVGHRTANGDVDATAASAGVATITSAASGFGTLGLEAGDWIKLAGFGETTPAAVANNTFVRVTVVSNATLTLDNLPTDWTAETLGGSDAVDIFLGERLKNGTTLQTYVLEEEFADHSPVTYQYFRGMAVDGLSVSASPQSIVTMGYTFSGKDGFFSDNSTPATAAQLPGGVTSGRATAAVTYTTQGEIPVMNSSSNVGRISRGGSAISGANFVLEASVEIANNIRQLNAVGFLGAVDVGIGEFSVSGTLNTYFDDASLARDVIANTDSSFSLQFDDGDDHNVVIDVPRIKFSDGMPDLSGKNADVTLSLSYQAIRETTFDNTLRWMRFTGVQ